MDLATVKASVKAWEKAFKAQYHRDPTKDDIKADSGNIAEQYSLYRKLSKASSTRSSHSHSHSQSSQPSRPIISVSTSSSSSSTNPISTSSITAKRQNPLPGASRPFPTTPTPPSRKSSYRSDSGANSTVNITPLNYSTTTTTVSLKRTASNSSSKSKSGQAIDEGSHAGPSTPNPKSNLGGTTPKRYRTSGYHGPIHDPNPINPFSVTITPTRISTTTPLRPTNSSQPQASGSRNTTVSRTSIKTPSILSPKPHIPLPESPFIHAGSPRKLREVLEANSLKKMREREASDGQIGGIDHLGGLEGITEITPRTRARKRLRGEEVEDTPVKDRIPRRKRGQGSLANASAAQAGTSASRSASAGVGAVSAAAFTGIVDIDSDEEEFGPSPGKPIIGGSAFQPLVDDDDDLGQTNSLVDRSNGNKKNQVVDNMVNEGIPKNGVGNNYGFNLSIFRRTPSTKIFKSEQGGVTVNKDSFSSALISGRKSEEVTESTEFEIGHTILPASPSPTPSSVTFNTSLVVAPLSDLPLKSQRLPTPISSSATDLDAEEEQERKNYFMRMDNSAEVIGKEDENNKVREASGEESHEKRREKIISLSEDEEDEWDPEGGVKRTKVKIVPTRRPVRALLSDDEFDDRISHGREADEEENDGDGDGDVVDEEEEEEKKGYELKLDGNSMTTPKPNGSNDHQSDLSSVPAPLLSLLSIHSPIKSSSSSLAHHSNSILKQLRAKAIFDPESAARLRAATRGQDVFGAGEGVGSSGAGVGGIGEDEDGWVGGDGVDGLGFGEGEDDDDWESDPAGWKAVEEEMW